MFLLCDDDCECSIAGNLQKLVALTKSPIEIFPVSVAGYDVELFAEKAA